MAEVAHKQEHPIPVNESVALLAEIDAILAKIGGKRLPNKANFCQVRGPFEENRNSLCDRVSLVDSWILWGPHPGSPEGVQIELSQHSFMPGERQRAIDRVFAQVNAGTGHAVGGISWCHAQVTWQEQNIWGVDRRCGVSRLVLWVQDILALLQREATLEEGAAGIVGAPGGWAVLVGPTGLEIDPPVEATQRVRMRVVGVAEDDVLWLREDKPDHLGLLSPKLGKLAPDARCIPIRMHPPGQWVLLTQPNGEPGWTNARYLEEEPSGACEPGEPPPI